MTRPEIPDTYDGCLDMLADLVIARWPGCDRAVERAVSADSE